MLNYSALLDIIFGHGFECGLLIRYWLMSFFGATVLFELQELVIVNYFRLSYFRAF